MIAFDHRTARRSSPRSFTGQSRRANLVDSGSKDRYRRSAISCAISASVTVATGWGADSFEDLYVDGQPAGQVGQEVYGAGAAFVFAGRSFHNVRGAPFRIFCDHFPATNERTSERSLTFGIEGGHARQAAFVLIRLARNKLPPVTLRTMGDAVLKPRRRSADRLEFMIPANGEVSLHW